MIYILLPAYNEECALEPLITKIEAVMREMRSDYRVVVVNDGSRDDSNRILTKLSERYPIDVITHKYNRGLGETARDGFEHIAEIASPNDFIVRMDCDDTHEPHYIPTMIAKLKEGYEVVITSRYARGGGQVGVDWYRRAISRIANLLFKTVFPIKGVWEYSCGFRAYRVELIQDALEIFGNKFIDLKGLGFTGTLEKLVKFRMMGARMTEIPFILRYDQKLSSSKVVTSITTLGCFILMIKHCRYWAAEGERWRQQIEQRKARLYKWKSAGQGLEEVRQFWNKHPLFAGESDLIPGDQAFFEAHERVTLHEHSDEIDPIFTRGISPGQEVLDVGCGIGFWVQQFGSLGAKIRACDLSETAVRLTRRRLDLFGIAADVREGNAEELPYEDSSFDHVNCQGVIHHTPDTRRCIQEFHRVLKPEGTMCFSVYYKLPILRSRAVFKGIISLMRPLILLRGRGRENMLAASSFEDLVRLYDGVENPIGKAFTRGELQEMLGADFQILEERRFAFPRRVFPVDMPTWLHKRLTRMLGLMIVLRCQKIEAVQREPVRDAHKEVASLAYNN